MSFETRCVSASLISPPSPILPCGCWWGFTYKCCCHGSIWQRKQEYRHVKYYAHSCVNTKLASLKVYLYPVLYYVFRNIYLGCSTHFLLWHIRHVQASRAVFASTVLRPYACIEIDLQIFSVGFQRLLYMFVTCIFPLLPATSNMTTRRPARLYRRKSARARDLCHW